MNNFNNNDFSYEMEKIEISFTSAAGTVFCCCCSRALNLALTWSTNSFSDTLVLEADFLALVLIFSLSFLSLLLLGGLAGESTLSSMLLLHSINLLLLFVETILKWIKVIWLWGISNVTQTNEGRGQQKWKIGVILSMDDPNSSYSRTNKYLQLNSRQKRYTSYLIKVVLLKCAILREKNNCYQSHDSWVGSIILEKSTSFLFSLCMQIKVQ